jgi:hypothetical protein
MPLPDATPLRSQFTEYLLTRLAAEDSTLFVKSKHIAADIDASSKEIGITLAALENDTTLSFRMSRHGGTSDGTTWRIEPQESVTHD